jgi:hypothetical protein
LCFKSEAVDCECLGISFHALTPSLLPPMIVIEVLDAYTFPLDVALVIARHMLDPEEPRNGVTSRLGGIAVQFHEGRFAGLIQKTIDRKLQQFEIRRGQLIAIFGSAENVAS